MTATTDRNDLLPAQEKLEWVTPKISLMVAGETHGKYGVDPVETANTNSGYYGPS